MHLRRALLLFAVVLGLAAIAASLSREDESPPEPTPPPATRPPQAVPGPERSGTKVVRFQARGPRESRSVAAGRPLELLVGSDEPGLAEIPELGLSAVVNPGTPARFELLEDDPGRYEVVFTPAAGDDPRPVGTLAVGP